MKTSLTKLSNSFVLFFIMTISTVAWSKPVAQVIEVKGQVFSIAEDGKTTTLKKNDHLNNRSEVMVGENGSITLNDYYDATYHLIEGSHVKFYDKSAQLKKGKAWIQSLNSRHPLALTTANGHVDYWKGEFIATFDQASGRSQFLVVNGDVEVSNVLDKNMKYTVSAGTFTLIDPEVDDGVPRSPTKVGLTSLNKALSEFKALPESLKEPTSPTRGIASVDDEKAAPAPARGKIIFINNQGQVMNRLPASSEEHGAHKYFKKKTTKAASQAAPSLSAAPIRIFGAATAEPEQRKPASIQPLSERNNDKKVSNELNIDSDFNKSLSLEKASQPKHSKELENLINDLKSY
jgi:hypothetical protein